MDYKKVDRDKLRQMIDDELLDTWQSSTALALRIGVSPKMALHLLHELRDEGRAIMTRARIDGHNVSTLFKRANYVRVLGMRMLDTRQMYEEV